MTARLSFGVLALDAALDEASNTYDITAAGLRGMAAPSFPVTVDIVVVVALELTLDTPDFEVEVVAISEDGDVFAQLGMSIEYEQSEHVPGIVQDIRPPPVPLRFAVPGPTSIRVQISLGDEAVAQLPFRVVRE